MSTHYTRPDCAEYRAPFPIVSRDIFRYRSAAEICAAITAAADGAPEFSDACYAPGAADWHGPTRGASFAHFLYCIDGARGSYSVSNTRENLLTLARKVSAIRAAFDGKPRRAPAAKRAPTSAPHVAARALLTDGNARDAIQLAENSGAVFFGAAAIGAPGVPYMGCETVEFFSQSFTIGRAIKTGRFLVLHTKTALSVSGSAHRDGFKTHSAALDWIETESACDAWRDKFHTALHGRPAFDQTAARARYFEDETAPVDTIEPAPVETDPAETAPDAAQITQSAHDAARALVSEFYDFHLRGAPGETVAVEKMEARADHWRGSAAGFAHDPARGIPYAEAARILSDHAALKRAAVKPAEPVESAPDAPIEQPAAIVPAADPAPAAPRAPRDGDRFYIREWKPGTAHSWRSAAPSDAPRDYLVRQAIIAGYIGGAHRWAECAQTGAFLYGIGADTRPIHAAPVCPDPAPVDPAPRADAAPVDTGAADPAPGAWVRPDTGMLSEAEARAWPSAEPVESASTPGYAFPADALPATHSETIESAPADDGGFLQRVNMAAAYISGGRRASRAFSSCFEMWDGDAVGAALLRRAEKRPASKLAANLWRYLAREHVEAAAARHPAGLTLAEWSRALIAEHTRPDEPAPVTPEPAVAPASSAPAVEVLADGFGFYWYALADGTKWTGRESFAAAAAELASVGMQARAGFVTAPAAPDPVPGQSEALDDDTIPEPLDGLDVIETTDAETLAEFDRLSRAPGVSQPASDARPMPAGPVLRIPAGDLRARIPARFAPAYLLTA